MAASHDIIFAAGILCLAAILAGLLSARIGTPLLLVFIGVGMLAGEDGPGHILFNDFRAAYLTGSLALAAILFQGGLSTNREMIRQAVWPSAALATAGVVISAAITGAAARWLFGFSWPEALLLGAVMAPTDAAAVSVLLHLSRAAVPSRVIAALEIESGLNDPMSVFLTVGLAEFLTAPHGLEAAGAIVLFLKEMAGGAILGWAGGTALLWLLRRLKTEPVICPVVAVGGALTIFGGAQILGASGFLAVYLAGVMAGNNDYPGRDAVHHFFGTLGWLAQIALFLMLGLLVTPHQLPPVMLPALSVAAVLICLARPAGVFVSLVPFRWKPREMLFVSWVGLRGAVPIYLTILPLLAGLKSGPAMFDIVFVAVIVSAAVQGWTIAPAAKLLRLAADA